MRSWILLGCLAVSIPVACAQSTRPAQDASAVSPPSESSVSASDQRQPKETSAPGESETVADDKDIEQESGQSSASSGDVSLPSDESKAWDTSQSDGKPATRDRGVKDYQAIIKKHRAIFRNCYDRSLAKHPGIRGQVLLKFVLDPKGKVTSASVDPSASDINEDELNKCMTAAIKSLEFPPSRRGKESHVRYPFRFNPHASK